MRLRRPGLIAQATKSMDGFDLVSKERVDTLRPACRSCRQSSGCLRLPRAKNEVWILGPQTPSGGRRATRVDVPYRLREA